MRGNREGGGGRREEGEGRRGMEGGRGKEGEGRREREGNRRRMLYIRVGTQRRVWKGKKYVWD